MNNNIFPCFWFNQNGAEAAEFYTSIFKNSKITVDTPMVINIEIEGQKLEKRDGFGVWDISDLNIKSISENTEILLMEVPMIM